MNLIRWKSYILVTTYRFNRPLKKELNKCDTLYAAECIGINDELSKMSMFNLLCKIYKYMFKEKNSSFPILMFGGCVFDVTYSHAIVAMRTLSPHTLFLPSKNVKSISNFHCLLNKSIVNLFAFMLVNQMIKWNSNWNIYLTMKSSINKTQLSHFYEDKLIHTIQFFILNHFFL